jgi:hypothetical protein
MAPNDWQIGTLGVQMQEVLPWLVRWALRAGMRDFCPALAALVGPVHKIFFPRPTLFIFVCPHRPASGQAVVQGRLSLNVCFWFLPLVFTGLQFLSRRFFVWTVRFYLSNVTWN